MSSNPNESVEAVALKPCPFCGGEAIGVFRPSRLPFVECPCGVEQSGADESGAIRAWNTRATPQPSSNDLADLIADLRAMAKGQREGAHYEGVHVPADFVYTAEKAADALEARKHPVSPVGDVVVERLRNSLDRHDRFGPLSDNAQVYVSMSGGNLYELIPSEDGAEPLSLGDLRSIATLSREGIAALRAQAQESK